MYTITVDVIREVLELSLRGNAKEIHVADLTAQLRSALRALPVSRTGAHRVRIKTRPCSQELTSLAEAICQMHNIEPDFSTAN